MAPTSFEVFGHPYTAQIPPRGNRMVGVRSPFDWKLSGAIVVRWTLFEYGE
jgi:hypothetical protein